MGAKKYRLSYYQPAYETQLELLIVVIVSLIY